MNAEERNNILKGGKGPKGRKSSGVGPTRRDADGVPVPGEEPKMSFNEHLLSWGKTILSSLLIVMVVNGLLVASFVVPTGSMENEVMAGDFLFVNKFIYGGSSPQTIPFLDIPLPYFRLPGLRDPEKGDVIVFIFPGYRDQVKATEFLYYLKRCVATAGDTLQVINKKVVVNGVEQPVPKNAIIGPDIRSPETNIFPPFSGFARDNWGPVRIPKTGDVISLNDSTYTWYSTFIQREGHTIEKSGEIMTIDDKPATSYTVERDYCFGMGDNRDNSLDSRYWGFIPVKNVIGTPLIVYWSWDPNISLFPLGDKFGSIQWGRIFNTIH